MPSSPLKCRRFCGQNDAPLAQSGTANGAPIAVARQAFTYGCSASVRRSDGFRGLPTPALPHVVDAVPVPIPLHPDRAGFARAGRGVTVFGQGLRDDGRTGHRWGEGPLGGLDLARARSTTDHARGQHEGRQY